MMTRLANLISNIFNPLLIPTIAVGILFQQNVFFILRLPEAFRMYFLATIFIATFVLPILVVFIYYRMGLISNMNIPNRKERIGPLISVAIIYVFTYIMIRNNQISAFFNVFAFGAAALIVVAMLVSRFWKISIHMLAVGGMVGLFVGLTWVGLIHNPALISGLIILSGLVGSARLKLNAHTQAQVYVGLFTGIIVMSGLIVTLFYF
jgi:membrane-associated phospholipid phosphatase